MRFVFLLIITISSFAVNAQTLSSFGNTNGLIRPAFMQTIYFNNNFPHKKWSLNKYSGIAAGFVFFKSGNASVVSAPIGLQLNRRLNNNFYAFAGIAAAPSYINFNQAFISAGINKLNHNNINANSLGIYSRAELGLMYVNDAKTFSISGSIGIERNNYPFPQYNQFNIVKPNPVYTSNNK